jgi:hypothetical protein
MSIFNNKKPLPPKEYEEYIKKIVFSYENKLSDQKDRIFTLVEENKKIKQQLEGLLEKDAQISKTLTVAVQKAKEIEDAAKAKYNMEIERLKLFHSKWVSYYENIKYKLPANKETAQVEEFLKKMDEILGFKGNQKENYASEQYNQELRRLNKIKEDSQEAATVNQNEGIDLEQVLSPKNLPTLDDLIKEMGILNK